MKVFILTEGGKNIGFGHLTRCISLYQAFEEGGVLPEFIVNGDESIRDLLRGKKHKIFNWIEEKEKLFGFIENADIVIVDSYLADISLYKAMSALSKIPVYIDDNKRINYPEGIVMNGAVYAEDVDYIKNENVEYLAGPEYMPLRKEFWKVPEKEIRERVQNIMMTFGGDDAKNMTPKILMFLNEEYPELMKNVVIGRGFQNMEEIDDLREKKVNLIYYPDAEKMKEIMLESDIAISAGGQSLYELAGVGVPTIGICVAENQLENVEGWAKAGFLEYAGWYSEKNLLEKIRNSMKHLEDINIRRNKSELGRKRIDGKGSLRVVGILLFNWFKDNLYLRNADFEDALDIFNLSNDETVRNNSFNPEKIEWDHHSNWLKEKLKDKNCLFLIVSDNSGKFYGQVRFVVESETKEATINISLAREIRGFGLSSLLIEKSVDKLLEVRKDIKLVKAFIKESNVASIRSFEKANFKFLRKVRIKGNKSKIYMKETGNVKI